VSVVILGWRMRELAYLTFRREPN